MKRVYADMVLDLFHRGHVEFIRKAKSLYPDTYLIIGVHSDETVASYKRKPFFSMEDRVAIAEACKYVDEVIPDAPLRLTEEFIENFRIEVVLHGDDMSEFFKDCYSVPLKLGIMRLLPYYSGISTTRIIEMVRTCPR
jgi:cytidyltransferase-like protein